ncbi:MAG: ABC transporter substrate-binding protein [Chloroflexaceae bacterium]
MMRQTPRWTPLALLLVLMLILAACGGAPAAEAPEEEPTEMQEEAGEVVATEAADETPIEEEEAPEATVADAGDAITLEFWHAMGGELGELVDELVVRFNDSQDAIVVNAVFQGTYDDTYNALLAAFDAGTEPHIVQNFDLATQTMIDTERIIPVYELMEQDNYDAGMFVPAVRDYYSDENGMLALAFNSSTPLIYYNADMLAEAGVEPPPPDWTFSDLTATCDQILAAENAPQYCFTFGQVGWYFEQMLANSGGLYFNENNGRTGRAGEVVFNQNEGVEVFTFLTDLIQNDYSPNLGNTWTDTDSTFTTGQAAMMIDSTSDVAIIENSDFEVGTAFIPHTDNSERNGVIIGGAALWLIDTGTPEEQAAAWEFMKFMAEPEQQITWHTGTGYFPVRTDLMDNPDLEQFWEENPNFRTAIEQLNTTNTTLDSGESNYAVLGGRAGPFPAIRRIIVESYSRVLDDGLTPQEALDEAAEQANQELADYNEFFE